MFGSSDVLIKPSIVLEQMIAMVPKSYIVHKGWRKSYLCLRSKDFISINILMKPCTRFLNLKYSLNSLIANNYNFWYCKFLALFWYARWFTTYRLISYFYNNQSFVWILYEHLIMSKINICVVLLQLLHWFYCITFIQVIQKYEV